MLFCIHLCMTSLVSYFFHAAAATSNQLLLTQQSSKTDDALSHAPEHQLLNTSIASFCPEDNNVLKKIVSFTVEQIYSENALAKARPSYVAEKFDFSTNEHFEGECNRILLYE